jgi:hypothetical protein
MVSSSFCFWLSEKLDLWYISVPLLESTCNLYSVVFQIPSAKILCLYFQDDFVIVQSIFPGSFL